MEKHFYSENGTEVLPGSIAAHEYVAECLRDGLAKLDEIEYGLLRDDVTFKRERHVLETVKSAIASLRSYHVVMAENLERYDGDIEVSRNEAVSRLDAADKRLRQKTR